MDEKVQAVTEWPPSLITSTKFPIQFYVDHIENQNHDITQEDRDKNTWAVIEGDQAVGRLLYFAGGVSKKGPFAVDAGWPGKFRMQPDLSSIDEGSCDLLYGLVRATRPSVCLETGTHKGRSTHSILMALCINEKGHLYTLDCIKWVTISELLSQGEAQRCTQIVGVSPHALNIHPLGDLKGIDFAFLDGAHDGKTLIDEINYVNAHRADTCIVVVDNALDSGWPEIRQALDSLVGVDHIAIETMAGFEIISLRNYTPVAADGATRHITIGGGK